MFNGVTLTLAKRRLKWFKQNKVLTVEALLRLVKEIENDDLKIYWDYRDELSKNQIEKIEEFGQEGYNEVCNSIIDQNYDYACELEAEQRINLYKSLSIEDFKQEYLQEAKERFINNEELSPDCELEEVVELIIDELEAEEDVKDLLREFQEVDYAIEDLSIGNYDKSLWTELEPNEFYDLLKDDIAQFEKEKGLKNLKLSSDLEVVRLRGDLSITDVNEIIEAHKYVGNLANVAYFEIACVELYDEDEDKKYEMELNKQYKVEGFHFGLLDTNEYEDCQYEYVYEATIKIPSEEEYKEFHRLFAGITPLNSSSDDIAKVHCEIDGLLVVEADKLSEEDYEALFFDNETKQWKNQKLDILFFMDATFKHLSMHYITLDGELVASAA